MLVYQSASPEKRMHQATENQITKYELQEEQTTWKPNYPLVNVYKKL